MRSRWFSTLIACALLAGAATAEAVPLVQSQVDPTAALPDFDACLSRLDPELDIGYERIAAHCPELMKQLDHGTWVPWLPRDWKEPGNDLSAGSLKELRDLVKREATASIAAGRSPDVGALRAVLAGLETRKPAGWWSRFKSWLRSVLETRDQTPSESWFSRMVGHVGVPQSFRQLIAYAALIAVVVLAALIIVNEVRAAGLFRKTRDRSGPRRHIGPARTSATGSLWSDIEHAPLLDKPRLLLDLIVRRLAELGYLPPAGALTSRELTRVARLPESVDRMQLEEVANAAEQVRYGAREPEAIALEGSIARGRELLNRLNASAPQ